MTDVACLCGCCYRFDGDSGACPTCGESVSLGRASDEIAQQMRNELRLLLNDADAAELRPLPAAIAPAPRGQAVVRLPSGRVSGR